MKQFGLEFDEIRIPLYTADAPAQIRQYSPAGKVPVLLHGNQTVWDSLAILEYLAEEFPDFSWWSTDKTAKAIARSVSAEMHSGFQALRNHMPMNCRAFYPGKGMTPEVQKDIDRITSIWQTYRQTYQKSSDFLFGHFTIADAMFAPVVLRFKTYGVQLDPVCQTYADTILALPALQSWIEAGKAETESLPAFEY